MGWQALLREHSAVSVAKERLARVKERVRAILEHFPDLEVLFIFEALLLLLVLIALSMDWVVNPLRTLGSPLTTVVMRGETTMNALYIMFGVATIVYTAIVRETTKVQGYKVALIVTNYACLTYLFFLSFWFRNTIFIWLMSQTTHR